MTTRKAPERQAPGPPPSLRGHGARAGGKAEDRAHYIPVGHQLRLHRERAGLNQRELAALTQEVAATELTYAASLGREPRWKKGLTAYAVNRFENNVHAPVPRNAELLAEALSVALSEKAGRTVQLTAEDLQVRTVAGLVAYLERIRWGKGQELADFYPALGIAPERAQALVDGAEWTADELGAVAIGYPEAADVVRDALIDQARRRRDLPEYRRWAVRDRAHPNYAPPVPAAPPDGGQRVPTAAAAG